MTIRKRLAHSNIAMLVIPLLTAAVLALLDAAVVLVLLRGDIAALHDALEQVESLLHGFKALPAVYLTAMTLLVLLTVAATNVYLTRRLFRHISEPLEVLTAGVAPHPRRRPRDTHRLRRVRRIPPRVRCRRRDGRAAARLDVSGYPAQLEPVTLPLAKEDGHG